MREGAERERLYAALAEYWPDFRVYETRTARQFPSSAWTRRDELPGKPRTLYPYVGGVGPFRAICQDVAEKGYEGLVLARH